MNFIKKLSGSFLLGLAVIGLALSTSAFTNSVKEHGQFAGEIYVNTSSTGEYEQLASPSLYDDNNCENTSNHVCSWIRTEVPGTVPNDFTAAQADSLKLEGLIQENSTKKGIYPAPQ